MSDIRRTTGERRVDKQKQLNMFALVGIILGIFVIVVGAINIFKGINYSGIKYATYGGDFYTDIATSARYIDAKLKVIMRIVGSSFGALLIFIGGIDIAYFLFKEGVYKK